MDPHRERSLRKPEAAILNKCKFQGRDLLAEVGDDEDDHRGKIDSFQDIGYYSWFQSGTLSDLTIRASDGKEWTVHKIVVAKGCDFFAKAITSGFKESHTNVIEMMNDAPEAINALLEYLYVNDYSIPQTNDREILTLHLEAYIIGEIYCVSGLKEIAYSRFVRHWMSIRGCWDMLPFMVERIYESLPDTDKGLRSFVATDICYAVFEDPSLYMSTRYACKPPF
ncbi:hypothetical protein IWZ01DRAFT_544689 [Phyllosticta capitalensis]